MTDVPHFAFPFHIQGSSFAEVEQDTVEDVVAGVALVLAYRPGEREMLPEFGVPEPVFDVQPVEIGELRDAILRWEPRAATDFGLSADSLDGLIQHVILQTSTHEISEG